MPEIVFANFILAILGAFMAGFAWTVTRRRRNIYLLAAFGSLALAGFFRIASSIHRGLSAFSPGLESWGLILLGFGFLSPREITEEAGRRMFRLVILLSLLFLLITFGLIPIGAGYLFAVRFWQTALTAGILVLVLRGPHANKLSLGVIFFLWLVMALSGGDFRTGIQLLIYLGLFLLVYKNILFDFRALEGVKNSLVKEKEVILSFLERIGAALHDAFNLDEVLKMITNYAMTSSQASAGAIFLLSEDKKELTVDVVEGLFPPLRKTIDKTATKTKYILEKFKTDRIKVGEGVVGQVAETGRPILIKDAGQDPRTPPVAAGFLEIKTMVAAPLKIKEEVLGVIALVNRKDDGLFSEVDASLLHALGNQAAISINNAMLYQALSEKKKLEQELQIARDIQQLLLPESAPKLQGFELASLARPAKEVGGDYYDYIQVSEDEWGLVIADVSGKGVPGALVMAMVRSMLRAEAIGNSRAAKVLSKVNRSIYPDIRDDMFISLFYLILNTKKRTLNYARAGHDPSILFHADDGRYELLFSDGMALGVDEGPLFNQALEELQIELKSGDAVILYTDGITEAMNADSEEFGLQRLLDIAKKGEGSSDLVAKIDREVSQFTGGIPQRDDITLVVLTVK
ncbi:SpoIIE family protein phosphatase [candidate division NPL-UPA2 bacterium]|nr:SpoIIE family protein phosphatase [candidate division NPL-UPA2 bacterium]